MSFILGLTGGIGSGKSAATDHFQSLGINIVDADIIAHKAVSQDSPALSTIAEHFGKNIILSNGDLNRAKLRDIIFHEPREKQWLESLLHPIIRKEIRKQLALSKSIYTILSAPLLFENNLQLEVDRVLAIDCEEPLQIKRASQRDDNKTELIEKIISQQIDRNTRLAKADDVIDNSGSLDDLRKSVEHYHQQLINYLT